MVIPTRVILRMFLCIGRIHSHLSHLLLTDPTLAGMCSDSRDYQYRGLTFLYPDRIYSDCDLLALTWSINGECVGSRVFSGNASEKEKIVRTDAFT